MTKEYSLWDDYCAKQSPADPGGWPAPDRAFWDRLGLPAVHPFCTDPGLVFPAPGVPPMGPAAFSVPKLGSPGEVAEEVMTLWYRVAPALLAMAELWLRLFAGALAPLGCLCLATVWLRRRRAPKEDPPGWRLPVLVLLTVAASLVLMTDTYYVLHHGAAYGIGVFAVAVGLSAGVSARHRLRWTLLGVAAMVLLAAHLVWDPASGSLSFGDPAERADGIAEGLYHDPTNPLVGSLVGAWPERFRTYSPATGATPWMPTGDARTGLPFLFNHLPEPDWQRAFLETDDGEFVALDVSFPVAPGSGGEGEDAPPLYLILHGLNGGSKEEYIRDFAHRRNAEGSIVVVLVARGLMDLPVRGWNLFHGARTTDAHTAAKALRATLLPGQSLIGVGFSMGAIVLANYVATIGADCALDGAIALSGGIDMRAQTLFHRAQRLWQPMLAQTLRDEFFVEKWGHRVEARLTPEQIRILMRASHVTEIDTHAVVAYNGFEDLDDYYSAMSALGDVPRNSTTGHLPEAAPPGSNIQTVSVPLCIVHALDDPLITWKATADHEGLLRPENLVRSGSGHTMVLLTKAGGHVGWPLGILPSVDKWRWMSDVAGSFGNAVSQARAHHGLLPRSEEREEKPAAAEEEEGKENEL